MNTPDGAPPWPNPYPKCEQKRIIFANFARRSLVSGKTLRYNDREQGSLYGRLRGSYQSFDPLPDPGNAGVGRVS